MYNEGALCETDNTVSISEDETDWDYKGHYFEFPFLHRANNFIGLKPKLIENSVKIQFKGIPYRKILQENSVCVLNRFYQLVKTLT